MLKSAATLEGVVRSTADLRFFAGVLNSSFDVEVPPIPQVATLAQVKEFCSGLLIPTAEHPWRDWWQALPPRKREGIAHSLFLFRKTLPATQDRTAAVHSYVDRMCSPQSAPRPEFLDFLSEKVKELFPRGWDKGYRGRCRGLLLPVSACFEAGRRRGGARHLRGKLSVVRRVALGWERCTERPHVKVSAIRDGPKLRIVSAARATRSALSPLHHLLYDHLSRMPWLLRGDAKPTAFSDFCLKKGEVFVSGDYEGATDNLSLVVYQHLLKSLSGTSEHVPPSVWELALGDSQSYLWGHGRVGLQQRGQLMGNYLSFPALCLTNYLTFKYAVPREVPVRVNGDDIVFRATLDEYEVWRKTVGESGLVLSEGKTRVHDQYFTLNSALFAAKSRGAVQGAWIRAAAFLTKADSPAGLKGQFLSLGPGLSGRYRRSLQVHFLRRNMRLILLCQRSVTRGLDIPVSDAVLRMAGLYRREKFYRSLEREEPLPRMSPDGTLHPGLPPGFRVFKRSELSRREWKDRWQLEPALHLAFRISSQDPVFRPRSSGDWLAALRAGTQRPWVPSRRVVSMAQRWGVTWPGFGPLGRKEGTVVLPVTGEESGRSGCPGLGWCGAVDWAL